ncbi:LPXTG cell wall anchor domain-containing protein [Lactococcus protaetiae]|uniref:LPXTG cell wall anchor domain-containing protein n=1 Tax=Lactococcus protaetiae TaxID=2592653 RepID=A0A514Z836_9LACT|nr:LPXTG cell wall anchor domain-containing protein [Lactococcus protaetiae]QDK70749.1 LPXTG cell wall anchor domain-containing protein [Lactococcus protaetiae]
MSKWKKLLNALTSEKKVTNWKMRKVKKVFVYGAAVLGMVAGVGGLVYVSTALAASLPTDTTVHWDNDKPLYYEIDQNGVEHPKPLLTVGGDGVTPAWCLGLGVPLPNNTTQAQLDSTNAILNALSDEQIAVINNVDYLAQKDGSLLAYAQAQHATYLLLDEAGVSENQTKDLIVKDNTLLQDADAIKNGANTLINEAKKMRELPSFNGTTIQLIQGVEKTVTDTKGVLPNFPNFKSNADGLTQSVLGNDVKLKADITSKHGLISNALQFWNTGLPTQALPYFVYSTDGDSTGKLSQSVLATKDPSQALANLSVNIIGLGETTLLKHDADTNSTETQGEAQLVGSVWGLYKAGTDTLVNYSEGQDGYPVTVTSGDKTDDKTIQLKMTDLTKGVGVKNLDNSKDYEWGELVAPEGYELSTKRYPVTFDSSSSFDSGTSNYIDNVTATDRPLVFNFMFTKAQDVNGSYTGLNGAEFTATPQGTTKGNPIKVSSGTGTDTNGYTVNGLTVFDGKANSAAGNPNEDGLAGGDYLVEETKVPDGTQAINPFTITTDSVKDKDGNVTGYTIVFKDTVTHQVITTLDVSADKVVGNNLMFKVNLGTLVDKPVTPVVPTIKTKAHTADGDQTIEKAEISKETPVYDKVMMTNAEKGDQMVASLHRIVTDKDGKTTDSKVIRTLNFTIDDETVISQEKQIQSTIDATKDGDVSEGSTVTYVWTEELFDEGTNPDTDKPEAVHDDLKDQDQTLTVEKVKAPTPKPVTPQPVTKVASVLPTTGSSTGDMLAYGGMVILLSTLGGTIYYMKNKKSSKEE